MDEELKKIFAHMIEMLHTISIGQNNILNALDQMHNHQIDMDRAFKSNEALTRELRRRFAEVVGDEHEILKLMKKYKPA